jgi:membrane protein
MKKKFSFKGLWEVLKDAFKGFADDRVTKLSGSLAYATVFSMAPLLIMIISLAGIFLGTEAVEGKIYGQLAAFVGHDTAVQLQDMIKHASLAGKSKIAAIIGGISLLVGATAVFAEIQDSINNIWGLKAKPKKGWLKIIQTRLLSFSLIATLGFLLLVSLGISALVEALNNRLKAYFPEVTLVIFYILNILITLLITAVIFGVVFKVLPDAKVKWKDIWIGAIATSILFMLGKFAISFYISKSNVGSTYGAAGSLVILLLWVYYSSIILYFGAEFTNAYALKFGSKIMPNDYAVTTKTIEVENGKTSVQQNEKEKEKEKAKLESRKGDD